ncbi:MAG: shikimate kinase [Bacteroidales bacterium]|nr:shikimate kinase [Bacteroidales bacterium]
MSKNIYLCHMIIALTGFMGSGKTTVGRELSALAGLPFIDLDERIRQVRGCSIPEIFASGGEAGFRKIEFDCLKDILEGGGSLVLSLGGGTVTIPGALELLGQKSALVYLEASPQTILSRLGDSDGSRPLFHGKDFAALLESRRPFYEQARLIIPVDGKNACEVAKEIKSKIPI